VQLERDSQLGKYIIRERLGGGGMGVVYRARHAGLGRDFALKVINPKKATEKDFASRFRREAEAIAKIDHPNIVSVADFVEGDPAKGEISYIVMECLRGKDLSRIIKETGPLEITRAVDRILEVIAAVEAAHRYGYLHRDIKPTNIFITEYNFIEVAKVLDFGVAKVWAQDDGKPGPQDDELTKEGTIFGAPGYIAPELLKGRSATPKSDQYSIGVVLFAALTGRNPFIADPKAPDPDLDLWMAVSKGIHPSPRSLRSDIPEQLEAVIERAMNLKPESRFQGLHELGAYLLPWASEPARHRWTQHFTSAPVAINLQLSIAIDTHTHDSSGPSGMPSPTGATIRDKPDQGPTTPVNTEGLKRAGDESAASARGPDAPSISIPISVDEPTAAPSPTTTGAVSRSSFATFLRRPVALVVGGGLLLGTAIIVATVLHRSRPPAPIGPPPPPALVDHPAPATSPPAATAPAPIAPPVATPPPPGGAPVAAPQVAPEASRPAPAKRPAHKRRKQQVDREGFPIPTE
jgi:serine/threonine-protein kinase